VPSKNVWGLLVAAWKSTFLLPAMTSTISISII
jgi:hypothetical protein